jgi:hypothetical protein
MMKQLLALTLLFHLSAASIELVVGVPGEVWSLNPDTGKLGCMQRPT